VYKFKKVASVYLVFQEVPIMAISISVFNISYIVYIMHIIVYFWWLWLWLCVGDGSA